MPNEITTVATSKQFSLNANDFFKGLIMAVGGAIVGLIQGIINAGSFVFNWTDIWHTALAATIVYLGKNFFTSSQVIVKPPPESKIVTIKIPEPGQTIVQ